MTARARASEPVHSVGARDAWQAEIDAGLRTRFTPDALWSAACHEMEAQDARRHGNQIGERISLQRAAEKLIEYRDELRRGFAAEGPHT